MKSSVKYDLSKINKFAASISDKHVVRVGIFGSKNGRKQGANTNAQVGAKHEFGSIGEHIPARSFLRMPISMKANQIIAQVSKGAAFFMARGDFEFMFRRLGIACEKVVQEAFETRGFGAWKPNAPATIKRKHSDAPLIDTAQLRRSISSQVVKI